MSSSEKGGSGECALYLKSRKGYGRCMEQLRKKWKTYGRAAGTIELPDASEEERALLAGIVGKSFAGEAVRFSCSDFEKGLQKTRFAPVDLKELLECYFGERLSTRREDRERKSRERERFFDRLCAMFSGREQGTGQREGAGGEASPAASWALAMKSGRAFGAQLLAREWEKGEEAALSLAKNTGEALNRLDFEGNRTVALAVLAAEASGNPHYFDRGTAAGQLLVHGICCRLDCQPPGDAHGWRQLLLRAGIVPDNVSSIVHCCGVHFLTERGRHPAYEAFCDLGEPFAVTMENLRDVVGACSEGSAVYVVENEMVFSCLAQRAREKNAALICTSGQPRSAAWKLLSLLVLGGCKIRYGGDMDPEGMEIADRIWKRYEGAVELWRMSPEDYERAISEEEIREERLARLGRIECPALQRTAELVRAKRLAAYQENIIGELESDLEGSWTADGKEYHP